MSLYKNCGWWKNCDCVFEFSVKGYVTNTINLSCVKILLPSVIVQLDAWVRSPDSRCWTYGVGACLSSRILIFLATNMFPLAHRTRLWDGADTIKTICEVLCSPASPQATCLHEVFFQCNISRDNIPQNFSGRSVEVKPCDFLIIS
jgi:hypothetical protein